jgi:hypothetical protein
MRIQLLRLRHALLDLAATVAVVALTAAVVWALPADWWEEDS